MRGLDFAKEYESKTDEELARLSLVSDQLTEDARQALAAALKSRGIDTAKFKHDLEIEEKKLKEPRLLNTTQLWFLPHGTGRRRYGKSNYQLDRVSHMERFTTTLFVALFWVPLIPLGTYRVQRKKQFFSDRMIILKKLPLDWTQVLGVWAVASVCLLCLVETYRFLPLLLSRIDHR